MDNRNGIIGVVLMAIAVLIIAITSEILARQLDRLSIFGNPAQITIYDEQDIKLEISDIRCTILPCGPYTGKHRQCVVQCRIYRGGKNGEQELNNMRGGWFKRTVHYLFSR